MPDEHGVAVRGAPPRGGEGHAVDAHVVGVDVQPDVLEGLGERVLVHGAPLPVDLDRVHGGERVADLALAGLHPLPQLCEGESPLLRRGAGSCPRLSRAPPLSSPWHVP